MPRCCRISTWRKPADGRKRKRKANKKAKKIPVIVEQETPLVAEDKVKTSNAVITNDDAAIALTDEKLSVVPKISNGLLNSQVNAIDVNDSPIPLDASSLFHNLCYSEDALSALPNRNWAIHSIEIPEKRVIVSAVMMHDSENVGLTPIYYKQIVFDEKLNFDILLVNSRIVLKDKATSIATMHDFEDLLEYVDRLKICYGGPPISQYSNINPECAYRDSMNNWRHNLCTLEINNNNDEVCESCRSLDEVLRRHAQRTKSSSKSRKR